METVHVQSSAGPYEVRIGAGALASLSPVLQSLLPPGARVLVVTDGNVAPLLLDRVRSMIGAQVAGVVVLAPGEETKNTGAVEILYRALLEAELRRSDAVVALGGGVVTDLAGFAAATWLRGIPWVAVPTTTLAQIDASVGGKTGVNFEGKNLVGAFHPPLAVISDLDLTATLSKRHFRAGLAEAVKVGLALDAELFAVMGEEKAPLQTIVTRAVRAKARVVSEDEREKGLRRVLNLGHTAGHAIEAASGYGAVLHGEAVAVGLVAAARVAERRGVAEGPLTDRVRSVLAAHSLPVDVAELAVRPERSAVGERLLLDKKRSGMGMTLVLPVRPGTTRVIDDATVEEILDAVPGL